jgi:hypothetical protein
VAEAEAAAYDFGSLVAPKENKELNCLMIYGYIEFKLTIQTHPIGAQVWPRTPWSWRSCLLAHTSGGETEEGLQAAKSLEAQASSGSAECMLQLGEP